MRLASRREVIKAGVAGSLALAAGARNGVWAQSPATTVRVATWGGSWRDSLEQHLAPRLAAKGIKVEYVLGNPDDNIAKLIAARRQGQVPFDVLEFTPAQKVALTRGGIFEKLDYGKLANAKTIPDWAREEQLVSVQYTVDGIVYNADRLKEAGVAPPQRYTDLKDPRINARLAFPEPANGAHWSTVTALAYAGGGSEANMAPAIKVVNEIKPGLFYSSSPDLATKFGSGAVWIAPWQSGWGLRLHKAGHPVQIAYPMIGDRKGALWPIAQGVIKGSPNVAAAHEFINEFLSVETQYGHGTSTGSLPVNSAARAKLAEDPDMRSMLLLADAQLENAFRINWNDFDQKQWRDTWSREIVR
jgi:putative spermidine/putrescine transport system substrate-binding protein